MKKSLLFLLILILGGSTAAGGYLYYTWPTSSVWLSDVLGFDVASLTKPDTGIGSAEKGRSTKKQTKTDETAAFMPTFDVLNLVKDGGSVFAGRAEPNSTVTVKANEIVIGEVKADDNGEWVLVVEQPLPDKKYNLTLIARSEDNTRLVQGPTVDVTIAGGKIVAKTISGTGKVLNPGDIKTTKVASNNADNGEATGKASSNLVKKLEEMVKTARQESTDGQKQVALANGSGGIGGNKKPVIIPVPIQFEYRKATFTPDGLKAVGLLLSYVKLKKFDNIKLSGHADRRGPDQYNMTLSEQRLQAVTNYLKEGGYKGKVILIPKGEAEPFTGVDRSSLPLEELFQLDRRVELHISE